MTDFNYQKAYCTLAIPAFNALNEKQKTAHAALLPLVGELTQGRDLQIPISDKMRRILEAMKCKDLAELARASYFVGHWKPSFLKSPFDNSKGESWKIANCCDQILREKLSPLPHNIQIHEGVLRVTFSNKDCWLWYEFALATEENLKTFKNSKLSFGELTLDDSAKKLAEHIGDLWPDVEGMPGNELYLEYLELVKAKQKANIQKDFENKLKKLDRDIESAKKEKEFLMLCNSLGISIENLIYYSHEDSFCFGWRTPVSEKDQTEISEKLSGHPYNIKFKTRS